MESEELEQGTFMFDDSFIKTEIHKEKDSYKEVVDSEIVYENVSMGKFISTTTLTPKDVEKVSVIRDFEKLGYKIEYNQVDGKSTAIIIK